MNPGKAPMDAVKFALEAVVDARSSIKSHF